MTEDRTALCEELARAYRVFGAFGWGDLGDGHISARDPERIDCFWMLGYGITFPEATADVMVLIDR
ncbi:MAG: class II aldolase/adducin family protein, partial [Gammaproteobacteria bacterium]|nr:class II aldolase/adducin family protein [Gammaproteobacteria bacterium]